MSAPSLPAVPAWIEPPTRKRRHLKVSVKTESELRVEYDGMFGSTFEAYDDAITRFPWAARVEVKPATPGSGGVA